MPSQQSAHGRMNLGGRLAAIAMAGFGGFILLLALLHLLRPDYGPVDHMISDYAIGRFGWLMTTAFVAAAAGCVALAAALGVTLERSAVGLAVSVLLVLMGAGLLVTAAFPTDLETAPSTRHGDIHAISFLANVGCSIVAAGLFVLAVRRDPQLRRRTALAAGLAIALTAAFALQATTLHRGAPYGLTNRLFVAVLMTWFLSVAALIRQRASAGAAQSPVA